jgi:hypothetical protein
MTERSYGKDHRFDTRVTEYALRRKEITKDEIQAQLDSLPDDAAEAVESSVRFHTPFATRSGRR